MLIFFPVCQGQGTSCSLAAFTPQSQPRVQLPQASQLLHGSCMGWWLLETERGLGAGEGLRLYVEVSGFSLLLKELTEKFPVFSWKSA